MAPSTPVRVLLIVALVALVGPSSNGSATDGADGAGACADGQPLLFKVPAVGTVPPTIRFRMDSTNPFPQGRITEGIVGRVEWPNPNGTCDLVCPFFAGPDQLLPNAWSCSKPFFQGLTPIFVEVSGSGTFMVCDGCVQMN